LINSLKIENKAVHEKITKTKKQMFYLMLQMRKINKTCYVKKLFVYLMDLRGVKMVKEIDPRGLTILAYGFENYRQLDNTCLNK